jgi:hypothetical protein
LNKSPQADPITSRVFLVRLFSIKKQFRHDKVEIELGLVNGDKKKLIHFHSSTSVITYDILQKKVN